MSINNTDSNRFDAIENYDEEIPKHVAEYLTHVKTDKNLKILAEIIADSNTQENPVKGIDIGCGTGEYIESLQKLCPEMIIDGLDYSEKQIEHAKNKGIKNNFFHSSMSDMSAIENNSYDFSYAINSIHHLPSRQEQINTFNEVYRILKAGGVFIVHEINTKNPIIKFYVDYIFPRIRNIDDGSEIWLTEDIVSKSKFCIEEINYFTFLPDFTPKFLMGLMVKLDKVLSASRLSVFGAHVMYVLKKSQNNNDNTQGME